MNCRTHLMSALLATVATGAMAEPLEKWGYPDPETLAKAVHALCEDQNRVVLLAAKYREEGRTKEDVLALIPENPPTLQLRSIDAFRESVEDVYAFPQYDTYSMVVFRAETCRREVMSARTLPRLATVHQKLGACEAQHGKGKSKELYACVQRIVLSM